MLEDSVVHVHTSRLLVLAISIGKEENMSSKRKSIKKNEPKAGQGQGAPVYPPMYQFPNQFFMTQQHGGGMQPAPFAMPAPNGGTFFMMPPAPASCSSQGQSRPSTSKKKPWAKDDDDDDEEDDDDDDFAPPKPKKRLSLGSKGSEGSRRSDGSGAAAHLNLRRVQNLPPKFMGRPTVSHNNEKDCVSCGVYLGEIMLVPCGHASFCTKCINKLHDKSNSLKRLQLCPAENCLSSVSAWVRLHNIMA